MPAAPDGTDILLSSGTWSLVGFKSTASVLGSAALGARVANDRTGRGGYRSLINAIGLWLLEGTLKAFATAPTSDTQWAALVKAAEKLPAPARLLDVTDPVFATPPSHEGSHRRAAEKARWQAPHDLTGYTHLICASLGRGHADVSAPLGNSQHAPSDVSSWLAAALRTAAVPGHRRCQWLAGPCFTARRHSRSQHRLSTCRAGGGEKPGRFPAAFCPATSATIYKPRAP